MADLLTELAVCGISNGDAATDEAVFWKTNGTVLGSIAADNFLGGIACSRTDNIIYLNDFVGDFSTGYLRICDEEGTSIINKDFFDEDPDALFGIALWIPEAGFVWVAVQLTADIQIWEYSSAGVFQGIIASGLDELPQQMFLGGDILYYIPFDDPSTDTFIYRHNIDTDAPLAPFEPVEDMGFGEGEVRGLAGTFGTLNPVFTGEHEYVQSLDGPVTAPTGDITLTSANTPVAAGPNSFAPGTYNVKFVWTTFYKQLVTGTLTPGYTTVIDSDIVVPATGNMVLPNWADLTLAGPTCTDEHCYQNAQCGVGTQYLQINGGGLGASVGTRRIGVILEKTPGGGTYYYPASASNILIGDPFGGVVIPYTALDPNDVTSIPAANDAFWDIDIHYGLARLDPAGAVLQNDYEQADVAYDRLLCEDSTILDLDGIAADADIYYASDPTNAIKMYLFDIVTGDLLSSFDIQEDEGKILAVPFDGAPPTPGNAGSGLYYIERGKRNDSIYTGYDPLTTDDVEIPNPFIETYLVGDE